MNLAIQQEKHETVLINEWDYFQPAGDNSVSSRNGAAIDCNSNGNRNTGTSNFQRPILSCLNETSDQQHEPQKQHANHAQCQHQQLQCDGNSLNPIPLTENHHHHHQQHQQVRKFTQHFAVFIHKPAHAIALTPMLMIFLGATKVPPGQWIRQ